MAEWNEHILQITAEMTKRSKERLKNSVIDALTEGARVDFNNTENLAGLHQLAHAMRKIFAAAGDTTINFAEMIKLPGPELFDGLKKAAAEFETIWASAVSKMSSYSLKDYFMEDAGGISIALKNISDQNGRIIKEQAKDILRAFEPIKKTKINDLIDDLYTSEGAIEGARTWEDRTAAALRYINVYERLLKLTNGDIDMRDVARDLMPFAKTIFDPKKKVAGLASIDELRKALPAMQTSLQNIFNMAMGKPLIGLTDGGAIDINVAPVVINKLNVGDLFNKNASGGEVGVNVVPEIDPRFQEKLQRLFEANKKAQMNLSGPEGDEATDAFYEYFDEILHMFPEDMEDQVSARLDAFLKNKSFSNRSAKAVWKDFIGFGVPGGFGFGTGTGSGTGTGTGSGSGVGVGGTGGGTGEDVDNARNALEIAKNVEEAYKKLESFDSDPWRMTDEEEVNKLYQERLEIIKNIGIENLKSYDAERYDGVEYINNEYAGKLNAFKELRDDAIYKQLDEEFGYDNEIISESKELELLLARRREIMHGITFDAEEEYLEQEEINNAIERRISLMKELEPLVANGSLTRDDLEAIVHERGDLDERRKALFGVQTDLFNEEPEDLNEAQYVLDQYEKIIVKTGSGKTLTLGPEMSEEDWKSFMKIDPDKAKSIEFVRKEIQQTGQEVQQQAEVQTQANDAEIESNKKKIQSYNELSDAVSRYVELAKSLVDTENKTPEHMQIQRDMDIADTWEMRSQEDFIAAINEWQTNIGKIKAAIKAGADTYRTSDGYVENITDDTLSRAESTLRGYIYRYAENWDDVDTLLAGAKTKTLQNIITKEIGKYTADQDIQKQQEEIANAANAAALEEMERIEKSIEESALHGKSVDAWEKLSELKYKSDKVDRYTQSSVTDDIAKDLGIVSPHEEIQNNAKAIKSYEELCEVIQRYNEIRQKRVIFGGGEYPTPSEEEENEFAELTGRLNATRDGVKLTWREIEGDINKLAQLLGIEVPRAAQQAQQAVGGLNNELQETSNNAAGANNQLGGNTVLGVGSDQTDGATSEEVQNLKNVQKAVADITAEVKEKTQEFLNEQAAVKKVSSSEVYALGEVEKKVNAIRVALSNVNALLTNIKNGKEVGSGLSNITVNVNHKNSQNSDVNDRAPWARDDTLRNLTNQKIENVVKNTKQIKIDKNGLATNDTLNRVAQATESIAKTSKTTKTQTLDTTSIVHPILVIIQNICTALSKAEHAVGEFGNKVEMITTQSLISTQSQHTNKPKSSAQSGNGGNNGSVYSTKTLYVKNAGKMEVAKVIEVEKSKTSNAFVTTSTLKDNKGQVLQKVVDESRGKFEDNKAKEEKKAVKELLNLYERLGELRAKRDILPKGTIRDELQKEIKLETSRLWKQSKKLGVSSERTGEASAIGSHRIQIDQLLSKTKELGIYERDIVATRRDSESYNNAEQQIKRLKSEISLIRTKITLTQEEKLELDELIKKNEEIRVGKLANHTDKESNLNRAEREKEINRIRFSYEELGKLRAQFEKDGNLETKARLKNLAAEVNEKRSALKLTSDEISMLREKSKLAYQAEKRLVGASKEQEEYEKSWNKRVKDAQRETGINAATSAANAGDQTVLRAIGTEDVSKDIQSKAQELQQQIRVLRDVRDEIYKKGEDVSDRDRDLLAKQISDVKKLKTELDSYLKIHEKYSGDGATQYNDVDTSDFGAVGTEQYWNNITAAIQKVSTGKTIIKGLNADTGELTGTTRIAANTFAEWSATVDPITHKLSILRTGIKKTETFIEQIVRKTKEIFTYFSGSSVIFRAVNELKRGIQYVRDIDLALTELKKVTDETEETYDKFLKTAAKTGERLGSTISGITEATATFAKLGYTIEQASEMAEAAVVYKNVGDNIASTEDAADSIISTLKGFGLKASDAMAIVDKFNEVGNRFAITSQGIGEALRLSASALNEGGNSLDESIAMITAANEVVNDPNSVGTALKTLTLRLRGSKTELEEMGEDVSDMATTTSQLQAKLLALTGGKVDIMLDANTFKNSTQILREMAAAWEDMNDIQRASALELMGGKRQANVLSALIQNFDTVEDAIEASANSAGSALRENERWMDSIQGKINQFNNAMQAMWNNFLDADVVKFVVDLGTKLIKFVDTLGLIPSILVAIGAFKGLSFIFKGADILGFIKSIGALTMGTKVFEAETRKAVYSLMFEAAQSSLASSSLVQYAIKLGLASAAGVATMTTNQLLGLSFKALGVSIWGAVKAITAFLFTNPVGWLILAIGAVVGGIAAFNHFNKTTEELAEELSDLKSELSDIESDIESLNSELETTQERMAELLALPSLSFTEQEELKNLQLQNAELERQLQLKEMLLESKQKDVAAKSEQYIESAWNKQGDWYVDKNGVIHKDSGWKGFWNDSKDTKTVLDTAIQKYQEKAARRDTINNVIDNIDSITEDGIDDDELAELFEKTYGGALPLLRESEYEYLKSINWEQALYNSKSAIDDELRDISSGISSVFANENFDDLEYGMSEDIDVFLDELYAYQLKWKQAQGSYVKSDAISSMFDATSTKEMQELGKSIQAIANDKSLTDDQKNQQIIDRVNAIDEAADAYNRLEIAMNTVGVTSQDIADYFVLKTGVFDSSTVDGIIAQYELGLNNLKSMQGDESLFNELFDADGDVIATKVSEMMRGADETTREEFSRLLKSIKDGVYQTEDGLVDWEKAIESFSISGGLRSIELAIEQLSATNIDIFPGLEDEIKGIIDTFDELIASVGNTVDAMDALEQARAEEAYSGSVSLETLEKLMQSTDNYADLIEVDETGAIKLAANAQEILVQEKINTIKKNAEVALSTAQMQLAEAKHNQQIYQDSSPAQDVLRSALSEVGAAAAFVTSLWGDLSSGNLVGAWGRAKDAASAAKTEKQNEWSQQAAQATTSVAEAEKAVADAEKMKAIADGLTAENLKTRHDSDEASGGNKTKEEVEDDLFQREMDYWENRIAANQAMYEQVQNEIDLLEAKGQKASAEFYREQIELENERKWLLEQQKEEAQAFLDTLEEGSEEWWEVANTLNDIEGELDDVTSSILDLQDAIAEVDTYIFEEFNTRLDNLTNKLETIRDLIAPEGEESWFDDEGNWTDAGIAVAGTYLQELEMYKQGYQETMDELAKYQADYAGNEEYYEALGIHSEQEWYDKTEELISQQYDFAESISDTEQSIVDMYESSIDAVEEYVDMLIDGYNDYIDSVKEALDAERALFDFKKNVQKQAKDISELERRIASLSGSTNKADIAERRKLEAQLYESRESLNDTYYDHAKDAQQEALDAEQEAYETAMTTMIEKMRVSLEEATADMAAFLDSVTIAVSMNADTVLEKYRETEVPLNDAITNPWKAAAEKVAKYGGDANNLMDVWKKDGYFAEFKSTAGANLSSPWTVGSAAATSFKNSVSLAMTDIANSVRSNVSNITSYLGNVESAYSDIITTAQRAKAAIDTANAAASSGVTYTGSAGTTTTASTTQSHVDDRILSKYKLTAAQVLDLGYGPISLEEFERLLKNYQIKYSAIYKQVANTRDIERLSQRVMYGEYVSGPLAVKWYAKGTTGTTRDEWAITDEARFGDELVLVPGKDGNLSFMRKGTGVVPADLTANLMEWGQFTPDDMNFGGGVNINMINNAVNRPEFNFAFDALVKAENITEETLPAVKKLVTQELNRFTKELNYALKGKGAR